MSDDSEMLSPEARTLGIAIFVSDWPYWPFPLECNGNLRIEGILRAPNIGWYPPKVGLLDFLFLVRFLRMSLIENEGAKGKIILRGF
jgi:hypothetical protein